MVPTLQRRNPCRCHSGGQHAPLERGGLHSGLLHARWRSQRRKLCSCRHTARLRIIIATTDVQRLAKQHLYPPPSLRAAKRRDNPENAVATGCDGNSVHLINFTPDCSDMTATLKQGY